MFHPKIKFGKLLHDRVNRKKMNSWLIHQKPAAKKKRLCFVAEPLFLW